MGLSVATGQYAMRTTDGDDTIALGFSDGKCVILWVTAGVTNGTYAADAILGYGFSDCNNHGSGLGEYSICGAVQDNQLTSNANRYHSNTALCITDNLGALVCTGTCAFSGSNLVITWNWLVAGTAYIVHYLVLGGTDLTNARVLNSFQAKTDATGTRDDTGFGFDPDFVHFLTAGDENAAPAGRTSVSNAMGFAANKASRQRMWTWIGSEDGDAAEVAETRHGVTEGGHNASLVHKAWKAGVATGNGIMSVSAWITDGYTGNWHQKAGNAFYYGVLALNGLQYDIYSDLCPTSTGVDSNTGMGFQPEAFLSFMTNIESGFTAALDLNLGIGACTSTSDEHAAWVGDDEGAATSEANSLSSGVSHVLRSTVTAALTVDVRAQAPTSGDFFTADGIDQDFTVVPGTAAYQGWAAFGAAAAAATRRRTGPTLASPGIF